VDHGSKTAHAEKFCEVPSQQKRNVKKKKKLNAMVSACHSSFYGKYKIGGSPSRLARAKSETLSQK
jgi:hypothetical protein